MIAIGERWLLVSLQWASNLIYRHSVCARRREKGVNGCGSIIDKKLPFPIWRRLYPKGTSNKMQCNRVEFVPNQDKLDNVAALASTIQCRVSSISSYVCFRHLLLCLCHMSLSLHKLTRSKGTGDHDLFCRDPASWSSSAGSCYEDKLHSDGAAHFLRLNRGTMFLHYRLPKIVSNFLEILFRRKETHQSIMRCFFFGKPWDSLSIHQSYVKSFKNPKSMYSIKRGLGNNRNSLSFVLGPCYINELRISKPLTDKQTWTPVAACCLQLSLNGLDAQKHNPAAEKKHRDEQIK